MERKVLGQLQKCSESVRNRMGNESASDENTCKSTVKVYGIGNGPERACIIAKTNRGVRNGIYLYILFIYTLVIAWYYILHIANNCVLRSW